MSIADDAYNDALDRALFDDMYNNERIEKNNAFVEKYMKIRYICPSWTTRNNKKVHLYEMSDGHLRNLLRYLSDRQICEEWQKLIVMELEFRKIGKQERKLERKREFYAALIAIL